MMWASHIYHNIELHNMNIDCDAIFLVDSDTLLACKVVIPNTHKLDIKNLMEISYHP